MHSTIVRTVNLTRSSQLTAVTLAEYVAYMEYRLCEWCNSNGGHTVVEESLHTGLSLAKNDEVAYFAQDNFRSLPRSDQRRWAEVYLRGLLLGRGRKSVRRIAEEVLELPVSQSLQQFINQSPWDWRGVRSRIAEKVDEFLSPRAWVIANTTIPKRGDHSVGVERRFVPEEGRSLNCQVGTGLYLASDVASIPVNWRIQLTERWTNDRRRRDRAYIPPSVRAQAEWQYAADLVDEVGADWGTTRAPVVGDLRHMPGADRLMARLTELGTDFVFEVPPTLPVVPGPHLAAVGTGLGPTRGPNLVQAKDCLRGADLTHRQVVTWSPGVNGRPRATQALSVPVRLPAGSASRGGGLALQLVGTLPSARHDRPKLWLTNRTDLRAAEVIALGSMVERTQVDHEDLRAHYGLLDFEGRSYRGWHHHMTLVSAAFTFAKLTATSSERVRQPS
ncbi:IS701 family transposase [Actinokineospora iranica]|uniref:SRSO17 transposase n=1 Tax=Actinokineospora iranica TaxID=1271860 RepID=A0A1G6QFL9_9PSEU|nr:transposase [Actinokineospora iranica]SDC90486.1 SRSO17 transposase [Actinokineospora iranica]